MACSWSVRVRLRQRWPTLARKGGGSGGTLGGKADQKGEQNVVSMNSLSTMPCARLMTGHDSMPWLNLKSPAAEQRGRM
jgi:hypothetical protein